MLVVVHCAKAAQNPIQERSVVYADFSFQENISQHLHGVRLRYFDITTCFFLYLLEMISLCSLILFKTQTHTELVVDGSFTFKTIKCVRLVPILV